MQNHRLRPGGEATIRTWTCGNVELDHIGLWEPGGVDSAEVFRGLHEIGYRGYVTVHQAFAGTAAAPANNSSRSKSALALGLCSSNNDV